jgi:hypothetical protein
VEGEEGEAPVVDEEQARWMKIKCTSSMESMKAAMTIWEAYGVLHWGFSCASYRHEKIMIGL